jgi:hypothetical protein
METTVVLQEKLVMEGVQAWKTGAQRWMAFNAILRNHVQRGRMSMTDHEAYVVAAQAHVRAQDRAWALDAPDIQ